MLSGLLDKLSIITESLNFIIPEAVLTLAVFVIVLFDLISRSKYNNITQFLAFLTIVLTLWADIEQFYITEGKPVILFLQMIQLDQIAVTWKLILDVALFLTLCINIQNERKKYNAEFVIILLTILLASHLLVMSTNLLMVYLSIEIMSIGAYVLTTYMFGKNGFEAAMKYLLFGGVASAVMIYGISLIYTFTGTLVFTDPALVETLLQVDTLPMLVAGFMVMAGLLFKISAAPMHIWTPDVYQVAPTPAVAFFSIVPKLAAFALLAKWLLLLNLFGLSEIDWTKIVGGVAILTLMIGNFSALWQTNIKRMLAYSAIGHSGFMLMAFVAFSETGYKSLIFYAVIYLLMNVLAFLLINFFEVKYKAKKMVDYKGFGAQFPMLTVLMVVAMIALTGLPPTAGFTAKLFVFSAVWETYTTIGESWVAFVFAFGLINVVVSLFYYLKIPYYMIFKSNEDKKVYDVAIFENFLALILVLALLAFFFRPDWLMNMINSVNFAF